ncbi:CAP domain-containing protein [Streptosporangium sp. NPDC050855]|uniref:CAP domain-containing protein n=1 Tax=Streptosporangium sp. NPDC050855 TaxID=3366194 RepID=UPI00378E06B7
MSSLSHLPRKQQRLVPDGPPSRRRQTALTVTGAVLLSLTGTVSPAPPAAAAAPPLKGAGTCANIDFVHRPRSAFPDTGPGRAIFRAQATTIETAVLCLINAERTNLRPLKRYVALGRKGSLNLSAATAAHAAAAVELRWWGKAEPGKDCRPVKGNPGQCDPHINPQTDSTPLSRAQAVGYGRRCASFSIGENTYAGWGTSSVTPRAAVTWWMNSTPHRDAILNPAFTEVYTRTAWGSADRAAGSITPAVTYVQMFGRCD